jgi:Holliday junction DNA helicase RuvA
MICKIKGRLSGKKQQSVVVEKEGIFYQIYMPHTVLSNLKEVDQPIELVIYHYLNITKNKGVPILIGFTDELEKEFFEKFISVSGIGPKAALRAFDKPIPFIAQAIEEADMNFLTNLAGVGKQKAKQIIAHLQGKVGRFALIKEELREEKQKEFAKKEIGREAGQILERLQYKPQEINRMIKKAIAANPEIQSTESLLNEIYKQKKRDIN